MASHCSDLVRPKLEATYTRSVASMVTGLALLIAAPVLIAQTADRDRAEALAQRATDRLQALHREAERLASEETTLLGDLRKLEVDRQIKTEQFRQVDVQYRRTAADLTGINQRVHQLEDRDRAQRPALRARRSTPTPRRAPATISSKTSIVVAI